MKQKYKSESGRSMVEMLGVLAVIGVLSVAGIAGYSIAMRSYRTNEIVNAASMLYVMAMAKNQGNGADTNYTELGTPPSGATLTYSASDKSITVTFTDPNDCTMAANKLGDKATANTCSTSPATITVNFGGETVEIAQGFEPCSDCSSETCTEAEFGSKKCEYHSFYGTYQIVECTRNAFTNQLEWSYISGTTYSDNRCTQEE